MIYWDTSYLVKLYLREAGTDEVLAAFSGQANLVCCEHGRLELMTAFKRNEREKIITARQVKMLWSRHEQDVRDKLICYLPTTSNLIQTACDQVAAMSPKVFLRAADALHLVCAKEAGLKEVYSHDRHLLAAAPHFGLKGRDVITGA